VCRDSHPKYFQTCGGGMNRISCGLSESSSSAITHTRENLAISAGDPAIFDAYPSKYGAFYLDRRIESWQILPTRREILWR
jgi:hypothetical protein